MGTDTAYKVNIIKEDKILSFDLGDVTSALDHIFQLAELTYLSPRIDLSAVLTQEEIELLKLDNGEEIAQSRPLKAIIVKSILYKIGGLMYKIQAENLAKELDEVKSEYPDDAEKPLEEQISIVNYYSACKIINYYSAFQNDWGKINVLVEYACSIDAEIQFIANYY